MVMEYINQEQLDKWDKRGKKKTLKYHTALLELLQKKLDSNGAKLDDEDYQNVLDTFSSAVAIQRTIIDLNLENARQALQSAFEKCNFNLDDFTDKDR